MSAYGVVSTTWAGGSDRAATRDFLAQAMLDAGFPSPSLYTSGNVTIRGYNVAVPSSSRTATFLIKIDTGAGLNGSGFLQFQVCDSTQYNSSTGVVTGGGGWVTHPNGWGIGTTSSYLSGEIGVKCFKSKTGGSPDNIFNFVLILGSMAFGLLLPTKASVGGSYEWNLTNHTLALCAYNNPNQNKWNFYMPAGFNPYTVSTTQSNLKAIMYHEDLAGTGGDTDRQVVSPLLLKYDGAVNGRGNVFATVSADFGHTSPNDMAVLNTAVSGQWQCVSASASGALMARIA